MNNYKPLAPADETLIQYLKIGSDLINREKNARYEMSSKPTHHNPLLDRTFHISQVTLRAKNYINLSGFYKTILGLDFINNNNRNKTVTLGRDGRQILVIKDGHLASERNPHKPGLFHFALRYDTEEALASVLVRLNYYHPELFRGTTDDGVSLNFYFEDTEGNRMKVYADKKSNTWKWLGNTIQINPKTIDQTEFLKWKFTESVDKDWDKQNVELGHIHLQVSNLSRAKDFYQGLFGLNQTLNLPTVNFFSANDYHQHISFNTWNSRNTNPVKTRGLEEYSVDVSDEKYFADLHRKLQQLPYEKKKNSDTSLTIVDPTTLVNVKVNLSV